MQLNTHNAHLAYCTNIHPAETWEETFRALKTHTLGVRDRVAKDEPFAIGLRLSALAANELLEQNNLPRFRDWLHQQNCYVFTINGFPYGAFHGTRIKEKVYQPDWTSPERLDYTNKLFIILSSLLPGGVDGSVSTLPASFKEFNADENLIFSNLYSCSRFIETMIEETGQNLHLGLEPEPLGHFENTRETLAFFDRFLNWATRRGLCTDRIFRHIGINYDTCHFALEFDDCRPSLDTLRDAGLRISKVHLSSALTFDPSSQAAINAIRAFDEPTYLHQVITRTPDGTLARYKDLPDFLKSQTPNLTLQAATSGRIHFHIPLYANPLPPLGSTKDHAAEALAYLKQHPDFCSHFEIETYTWDVLPDDLQIPIQDQIAREYAWVVQSATS